jgi:DNA-binding NarL/FixJ family response regulator
MAAIDPRSIGRSASLMIESGENGVGQERPLTGGELAMVDRHPGADRFNRGGLGGSPLSVGLIDCYRFSQEALVRAWEGDPDVTIVAFATVQDCIAATPADLDIVAYHAHVPSPPGAAVTSDLAVLCDALQDIPLIVMSDAEDAQQPETIRRMLKSGARGFIPTRIVGIPLTLAVMRFVKAGGTYAPLDLLLGDHSEPPPRPAETHLEGRLTSRQINVLSHLKQGKANKTIAHELGMSESTVKVHVRNIMRTMGATNRTEAACKAQLLGSLLDDPRSTHHRWPPT